MQSKGLNTKHGVIQVPDLNPVSVITLYEKICNLETPKTAWWKYKIFNKQHSITSPDNDTHGFKIIEINQ